MVKNKKIFKLVKIELNKLIPHEMFREEHVKEVMNWFESDGFQLRPIAVYNLDKHGLKGKYLILDGHHRTEASIRLGNRFIMVNIINYLDPKFKVLTWEEGRKYLKEYIIKIALNGIKLPPKTTKHVILDEGKELPFQDNDLIEPKIFMPLKDLR